MDNETASPERCPDCGKVHKPVTGAICGGYGRKWLVYSHWPGDKKYHLVGKPTKSKKVAMQLMVKTMLEGNFNRVAVAFADEYYDPAFAYEIVKK